MPPQSHSIFLATTDILAVQQSVEASTPILPAESAIMEILQAVRHFFHGKRYANLSQDETEAFIDALCYAIAADGKVASVERDRLTAELDEIDWQGDRPVDQYIDESLERAAERVARGDDPELYARAIRDRIASHNVQKDIYLFAAQIAAADQQLTQNEQKLLSELVDEFDIPKETVEDVTGWIIFESDLQDAESLPAESQPSDDALRTPDNQDQTPASTDDERDRSDSSSDW